jgi:hypothetical protein
VSKIRDFVHFLTGFRKLTMGLLFMVVTLILLFLGKVSGSEFISTNRDVIVAFMATNVCAKIIGITKEWLAKKKK